MNEGKATCLYTHWIFPVFWTLLHKLVWENPSRSAAAEIPACLTPCHVHSQLNGFFLHSHAQSGLQQVIFTMFSCLNVLICYHYIITLFNEQAGKQLTQIPRMWFCSWGFSATLILTFSFLYAAQPHHTIQTARPKLKR